MVSENDFICVFLVVRPFLWYQGKGRLLMSNIKATFAKKKKSAPGALMFQTSCSQYINYCRPDVYFPSILTAPIDFIYYALKVFLGHKLSN